MGKSDFENLRVFQMAERLADEVWEVVKSWDGFAKRTVGQQIVRAADSVGANIAEGAGRGSYADNRRFVRIARGSLYEVKFFLRRAYRRGLLTDVQAKSLRPLVDDLAPMLNAYLRSLSRRSTNH
jgi:four helix bundle protein